MTAELIVTLSGRVAGALGLGSKGGLAFAYDDAWRGAQSATALSLSMPLVVRAHGDRVVTPWMWGLLPDNPLILQNWACRYGARLDTPFGLLSHVGEDCPGAVQLVAPERVAALVGGEGDNYLDTYW